MALHKKQRRALLLDGPHEPGNLARSTPLSTVQYLEIRAFVREDSCVESCYLQGITASKKATLL